MKRDKMIYWISTGFIFLFEGLLPALTSHTELAVEGVRHLGYPDYFRILLTMFKVLGSLVLVIPSFKGRYKEWAYAGFAFTMISAAVSHAVIDGMQFQSIFPLFALTILIISYIFYQRI
ncbi:MAG: DoxX family protein [Saprospiraceae bacterium]|nr:DoxX family protein [Saprospiraceae bacterium]